MENGSENQHENYNLKYSSLNDARKYIKLLLGRDPLSSHEVKHYSTFDQSALLARVVQNDEFQQEIFLPVILTGYAAAGRFNAEPSQEFLHWISKKIPLEQRIKEGIIRRTTWRSLLSTIWESREFLSCIQGSAGPRGSINQFQQGLRNFKNDRMTGVAPVFSRPNTEVSGCKLLFVKSICTEDLIRVESVDLAQKVIETYNLVKEDTTGVYVAEYDPQIIIQADLVGRFVLELEVEYIDLMAEPDTSYMQIFFDFGDGYQESSSCALEILNNKVSAVLLIDAEKTIQRLRVDPSVYSSSFVMRRLILSIL